MNRDLHLILRSNIQYDDNMLLTHECIYIYREILFLLTRSFQFFFKICNSESGYTKQIPACILRNTRVFSTDDLCFPALISLSICANSLSNTFTCPGCNCFNNDLNRRRSVLLIWWFLERNFWSRMQWSQLILPVGIIGTSSCPLRVHPCMAYGLSKHEQIAQGRPDIVCVFFFMSWDPTCKQTCGDTCKSIACVTYTVLVKTQMRRVQIVMTVHLTSFGLRDVHYFLRLWV